MKKTKIIPIMALFILFIVHLSAQARGVRPELAGPELPDTANVGQQYLILIAINDYEDKNNSWPDLGTPVGEVKAIKKILTTRYYINVVKEFYDKNASKENIMKCLMKMQKTLRQDDSLLIIYSGHGFLDKRLNKAYLIPYDAGKNLITKDRWIPNFEISGAIAGMKSKHILLIADSCFSGSFILRYKGKPSSIDNVYLKRTYSRRCRQAITSGALEKSPAESEFAKQLMLVLEENREEYMDALTLFDGVRRGTRQTEPMFGELNDTNHQEGAGYLFFLKTATEKWERKQKELVHLVKEAKKIDADPTTSDEKRFAKWRGLSGKYVYNNPFSDEDERLKQLISERVEELMIKIYGKFKPVGGKEDDRAFKNALKLNTIAVYTFYINTYPLGNHKAEAYFNLGVIHYKNGDYGKASENFSRAAKINPRDAGAYNNLGVCYKNLGEIEKSFPEYTNAIKIYRENRKNLKGRKARKVKRRLAIVYNNLGVSFSESGKSEDALKNYIISIELNRKYGDAYFNRGTYYLGLEDYENVIKNLKKAAKYNKRDGAAYEKLALAYKKIGKLKDAEKAIVKAKKFNTIRKNGIIE